MTAFGWAQVTEEAEETLIRRLDMSPLALPPDLERREGCWKGESVSIETRAYLRAPVAYARFAVVRGASLEIGNILCVPSHDHPIPILGADLVAIRRDLGMLAIDLSPTLPPGNQRIEQLSGLARARERHPPLPEGGQLPAWCSAWFSPHAVYTRGGPEELQPARSVVRDVVRVFVELAKRSSPSPQSACHVERVRQGYMAAHRSDDKGLNLLGKMFGQEWAERYVSRVLFPHVPPGSQGIDLLPPTP